jgi:N-acetylneuraminic acid mutarotase
MAAYPGGVRALVASAVVGGQLYAFGGSHPEPTMRRLFLELSKQYNLPIVPYNGVPQYRDAYRYDARANQWSPLRRLPFPMSGGAGVPYQDRYILILGTTETKTSRVGQAKWGDPRFWHGYNDVILCYDTVQDNHSRVGVMPYGVATCPWLRIGDTLYGFGGEPCHGFNDNTENVLQIGTILPADLDNDT